MKNIVLGTAGHVDHGKTTLIKHLTGVDTDRLIEEQSRGITIELGFAPLTLPDGQLIGILDVPGHEKFIRNMLAGASSIDIVLFVIAADEGIMPQTREHMDILALLGIKRGVVALTKSDAVDDEWMELVRGDVEDFIADSTLASSPIVPVSSVTGDGIDQLLTEIGAMCKAIALRSSEGIFRLAIDRSFVMTGFGVVVAGTVWGGKLKIGDPVEVFPNQIEARVRSIQVYGEKRDEVYAGERVAINLRGIERTLAEKGGWLAAPGVLTESQRIDVCIDSLKGAPVIKQRMRVHIHHGTVDVLATIVLLGQSSLEPGGRCFAQLEPELPIPMLPGDKFVIRFYSPMYTIAGGVVLDPLAQKHKKKYLHAALLNLEALMSGDPLKILPIQIAESRCLWSMERIKNLLRNYESDAQSIVRTMISDGTLSQIANEFYYPTQALDELCKEIKECVALYHNTYPLRFGLPKQELMQELAPDMDKKEKKALYTYLDELGDFKQDGIIISLLDWEPVISDRQQEIIDDVVSEYEQAGFKPPLWAELASTKALSDAEKSELLFWFLRSGTLIKLGGDTFFENEYLFTKEIVHKAEAKLRDAGAQFTLAEARVILETTRPHAQYLCDYFDLVGITLWDGVHHIWKT
ncbi:MAG: selenocysteine-specific translation elongation factor [Oscillospiraceae bacterium]|nr:selenocysteine-specific translation elongation factor [Oscillospiraceae bacterium]